MEITGLKAAYYYLISKAGNFLSCLNKVVTTNRSKPSYFMWHVTIAKMFSSKKSRMANAVSFGLKLWEIILYSVPTLQMDVQVLLCP